MILRLLPALALSLGVCVLIFWFMMELITGTQTVEKQETLTTQLQMVAPPKEPETPEPEPEEAPAEQAPEPEMAAMPVAAPTPISAPEMNAPDLDLSLAGLSVPQGTSGGRWRAPLTVGEEAFGKKGEGYVEVIPLSTRRPNIPELAWKKKIDGWVLVAFTITKQGRTRDVRILDAHPRGVFEDKAIKAVEDWTYDPSDLKKVKGDIVLTQKIELFWEHYPQNNDYLDD